jgi:hypothetical protein
VIERVAESLKGNAISEDRDSEEDQSLGEKVKAGEPLMEQAVQALPDTTKRKRLSLPKKWRSCASKRKHS